MATQNLSHRVVQGVVTDGNDHPLTDLVVRAFDRDMRSESLLGESVTDAQGRYRIEYVAASFAGTEKKTADLFMRVFGPGGVQVYETGFDQIVFNASEFETIDIAVTAQIKPGVNEFDYLLREISVLTAEVKTSQLQDD